LCGGAAADCEPFLPLAKGRRTDGRRNRKLMHPNGARVTIRPMLTLRRACLIGSVYLLAACSDRGSSPDDSDGSRGGSGSGSPGSDTGAGSQATAGQATGGQSASAGQATGGGSSSAGQSSTFGGAGGGSTSGGAQSGGTSNGGVPNGGVPNGGAPNGGTGAANAIFSECRFHFGTIDSEAKKHPELIPELDFFTSGWMGLADTFDQKYVCDEAMDGAMFGKQVPVIVAYVSAFYVKRHQSGLCDCNVSCGMMNGRPYDLCNFGAQYIKQDLSKIVDVYKSYARGFAGCFGTKKPIVFEMEPDWYQYLDPNQLSPMSKSEAASIIKQYVLAMKESLPNAFFSIDISPWAGENGKDNGKDWYSNFDLSTFAFANTSGGGTSAATATIRKDNLMTWAGVSAVVGKPLLADTGYGANGSSAGHDSNWDSPANINARIDDGVISISQYNPKADWAATIKTVRAQLKTPKSCP
jgi:hypothetical protein